ncbi:hypothetical protein LXM94_13360 [Rhizobium sp. TRM95111]|uniref:hypothetical protein n=1 Tax=Rhizobium alarense TaxID=2846851 RepID=UPI001F2BA4CC|nr:hypothetical protein [Rhizobium alarense]MCF3640960.1 hypothetical protein [Rhizobium alarense]
MTTTRPPLLRLLAIAVLATGAAALAVLGFAGWIEHGAGILLTMAESGLAWCL